MKKIRVALTIAVLIFGGFMITRSIWNKVERDGQADRLAEARGCGKVQKAALLARIGTGSVDATERFIECGFNVHEDDDKALRSAVYAGSVKSVKFLLQAGANVHADQDAALMDSLNNQEMLETLLGAGANPRARTDLALRIAAGANKLVAERLIKAGADACNEEAMDIASRRKREDIVILLSESCRQNKGRRR